MPVRNDERPARLCCRALPGSQNVCDPSGIPSHAASTRFLRQVRSRRIRRSRRYWREIFIHEFSSGRRRRSAFQVDEEEPDKLSDGLRLWKKRQHTHDRRIGGVLIDASTELQIETPYWSFTMCTQRF